MATRLNLVQHKHISGLQFLVFPGFLLFFPTKLRWLFKVGLRYYITSGGIFLFRALISKICTQGELSELLQAVFIHQQYWAPHLFMCTLSFSPTLTQRSLQNSLYHSGPDGFGTQTADTQ